MGGSSGPYRTALRPVWWYSVWFGAVLLPAVALATLTGWVPAPPGAALLLAGCAVAVYGTRWAFRRYVRGLPAAEEDEPVPDVWGATTAIARAAGLLTAPLAAGIGFGLLAQRQQERGLGPVASVAIWVLAVPAIALTTLLASYLLLRILRLPAVLIWTIRARRAAGTAPPPPIAPGRSGSYWVGIVLVLLAGGLTAGAGYGSVHYTTMTWRYHHAPLCSAAVTAHCRTLERARLVDLGPTDHHEERLTTADGDTVSVDSVPPQWVLNLDSGLWVTLERFDGDVVTVSAGGVTRHTSDYPHSQASDFLAGTPALAGLTWYGARFAWLARGLPARRPRSRRAERLRRAGLAVVIAGFIVFVPNTWLGGLPLPVLLPVEAAVAAAVFVLLTRQARSVQNARVGVVATD